MDSSHSEAHSTYSSAPDMSPPWADKIESPRERPTTKRKVILPVVQQKYSLEHIDVKHFDLGKKMIGQPVDGLVPVAQQKPKRVPPIEPRALDDLLADTFEQVRFKCRDRHFCLVVKRAKTVLPERESSAVQSLDMRYAPVLVFETLPNLAAIHLERGTMHFQVFRESGAEGLDLACVNGKALDGRVYRCASASVALHKLLDDI